MRHASVNTHTDQHSPSVRVSLAFWASDKGTGFGVRAPASPEAGVRAPAQLGLVTDLGSCRTAFEDVPPISPTSCLHSPLPLREARRLQWWFNAKVVRYSSATRKRPGSGKRVQDAVEFTLQLKLLLNDPSRCVAYNSRDAESLPDCETNMPIWHKTSSDAEPGGCTAQEPAPSWFGLAVRSGDSSRGRGIVFHFWRRC